MNYRTTNQLMSHLRENGIKISGSRQKKELQLIGYYHGYKGFRFYKEKNNRLQIDNFDELKCIVEFDINIKAIFYAPLMQLETALKSRVGQLIIEEARSSDFNDIFKRLILPSCGKEKESVPQRLKLRDSINQSVTSHYSHSKIVPHFFAKQQDIPLWGILEVIDLGTFGHLVKFLRPDIKEKISIMMGFRKGDCTGGKLAHEIVFILKGLRNAVAHNNPVFDARFQVDNTSKNVCASIERCTNINDVSFVTIVDFLVLIVFLMLAMGFTKTSVKKLVFEFKRVLNIFEKSSTTSAVYHKIVHTDVLRKIDSLENYIRRFSA